MELTVKKYLPHLKKAGLIGAVIDVACTEQDGIIVCDNMQRELYFNVFLVDAYVEGFKFELDKDGIFVDIELQYDKLVENGTMRFIIDSIGDDYFLLLESLDVAIENKLKQNTIEAVVGRLGTSLLAKVDDLLKTLTPEKVQEIVDILKTIDPKIAKTVLQVVKNKDK